MTEIRLTGKVIVITGGTQGIGEGVARAAAQSGAAGLLLTGRNTQRGERLAADLSRQGCPTQFSPAELGDEAQCRSVITQAEHRFGALHGLVNAAGLTDRGTLDNTSVALWDRLFAVNTRAPFILTQETARRMIREGIGGSIVNIITQSSHGGQPKLMAYSASKGALAILTRNNAHALRKHRIRVNGINIGWTDTPAEHVIQARDGNPPDWLTGAEAAQPFGRLIKPEDVAALVVYLLSDISVPMTGSLIDFDQNVIGAYD